MSLDVLDVIDFLLNQSGNIWWTWSQAAGESFEEQSVQALDAARKQLAELDDYYLGLANAGRAISSDSE